MFFHEQSVFVFRFLSNNFLLEKMYYKYAFYLCLRFFTVSIMFGVLIGFIILSNQTKYPNNYLFLLFMMIAISLYKLKNLIDKFLKRNTQITDDHSDVDSVVTVVSNQETYQGINNISSLYQDQHNQSAPSEPPPSYEMSINAYSFNEEMENYHKNLDEKLKKF